MKSFSTFILLLLCLICLTHFGLSLKSHSCAQRSLAISENHQTKFSCTCGIFVPLCQLLFQVIDDRYNIAITVKKSSTSDDLYTATFPTYDFNEMIEKIDNKILKLLAKKAGLHTIKLTNSQLLINIGKVNAGSFKGTVSLYGLSGVDFQIVVVKSLRMTLWAGVSLAYENIQKALENFVSISKTTSTALSTFTGTKFTMILSTNLIDYTLIPDLKPPMSLSVEKNGALEAIKPALFIIADLKLSNGKSDMSKFLAKYMDPNFVIRLLAKIQSDEFFAEASLNFIQFSTNMKLNRAGIFIKLIYSAPEIPEFGLEGELEIKIGEQILTLSGAIIFTPLDAGFKFNMKELWTQAFGLPRLHFGKLLFDLRVNYLTGVPTQIQFGGEISVGMECYDADKSFIGKNWCLQGQGYVGLNLVIPGQNYFYLNTQSVLNVETLLRSAVGNQNSLPKFPDVITQSLEILDDMMISFSPIAQIISGTNVALKSGFFFKGSVKILYVLSDLEFELSFSPFKFRGLIDVKQPIRFGQVLKIEDFEGVKGPKFALSLASDQIGLDVDCKVSIFGFSVRTKLQFDQSRMFFEFEAKWDFCPIMIHLKVETSSTNMIINKFKLLGEFKKGDKSFIEIVKLVLSGITESLRSLTTALAQAAKAALVKVGKWLGFGHFKETKYIRNSYAANFAAEMIKKDRKKAERIAAAFETAMTVISLESVSFGIDYDDSVSCQLDGKKLVIKMAMKGVLMDKNCDFEGDIDIGNWERMAMSIVIAALHKITNLF